MLRIRLQRIGRRNDPTYRVVVVESSVAAKKGVPVELLGIHDVLRKKTTLNKERITHWLGQGAQPSDTMHNVLITNGVMTGKKRNVLPKKTPVVKQSEEDTDTEQKDSSTEAKGKDEATAQEAPSNDTVPSPEG